MSVCVCVCLKIVESREERVDLFIWCKLFLQFINIYQHCGKKEANKCNACSLRRISFSLDRLCTLIYTWQPQNFAIKLNIIQFNQNHRNCTKTHIVCWPVLKNEQSYKTHESNEAGRMWVVGSWAVTNYYVSPAWRSEWNGYKQNGITNM